MDVQITKTSTGDLAESFRVPLKMGTVGVRRVTVSGAPVVVSSQDETTYHVVTSTDGAVHDLVVERKNYLHVRDVLSNLLRNNPRLSLFIDTQGIDPRTPEDGWTIVAMWDGRLACLLSSGGPTSVGARLFAPAPRFNARLASYRQLSCCWGYKVYLIPKIDTPSAVHVVLRGTSKRNLSYVDSRGNRCEVFVLQTLPPPSSRGYNVEFDRVRKCRLNETSDRVTLSLMWSDGTPCLFESNYTTVILNVRP